MDKKYVESGKVLSKLKYVIKEYVPSPFLKERLMKCVTDIPAADVREVRHGKWIYTAFYGCNLATVKCSICDYQCTTTKDIAVEICDFNYCSECGAKMDGEI